MRFNRYMAIAVGASVVFSACGSSSPASTTTQAPVTTRAPAPTTTALAPGAVPTNYEGFRQQPTACGSTKPDPVTEMTFDKPGDVELSDATVVTLHTSCGDIEIKLDPRLAPETTNSFVFLSESGYFDGSASHRVIPGFMIQSGDPTATGRGGPGYTVPDEFPPAGTIYSRGAVAMANAGPGTTGSQFFLMLADTDWLPPQYTVIGQVVSGLDAMDRIAGVPLGMSPGSADPGPSTPLESVYIESVSVQR